MHPETAENKSETCDKRESERLPMLAFFLTKLNLQT